MRARVTRQSHARREQSGGSKRGRLVVYQKGDEIDVTGGELRKFSDRIERIEDDSEKPEPPPSRYMSEGSDERRPKTELDELRQKARDMGITVDKRWGVARLKQAIEDGNKQADSE